jgi:hypothetical protein
VKRLIIFAALLMVLIIILMHWRMSRAQLRVSVSAVDFPADGALHHLQEYGLHGMVPSTQMTSE